MDTDGNSLTLFPTTAVSVLGIRLVEMRKSGQTSSDVQAAEILEELYETIKTMRTAFDLLAKRQTLLFQTIQELREAFERFVESQSKES